MKVTQVTRRPKLPLRTWEGAAEALSHDSAAIVDLEQAILDVFESLGIELAPIRWVWPRSPKPDGFAIVSSREDESEQIERSPLDRWLRVPQELLERYHWTQGEIDLNAMNGGRLTLDRDELQVVLAFDPHPAQPGVVVVWKAETADDTPLTPEQEEA